jgi:hypothetical protein
MTACRTIPAGLPAFAEPKARKTAALLAGVLKEWRDEPLALSLSPEEILTLPAWFPASVTPEYIQTLCKIEAGYFLRNPDAWKWQQLRYETTPGHPPAMEKHLVLFYGATPAQFIEERLQAQHNIVMNGLHFAPLIHLSTCMPTPQLVLELEKRYIAFFVSWNGRVEYFMYWPVKNESEREYFSVRELVAYPLGRSSVVRITGSAAGGSLLKRVAMETSCTLAPLGIPESISFTDSSGVRLASPSFIKAISTALMALDTV